MYSRLDSRHMQRFSHHNLASYSFIFLLKVYFLCYNLCVLGFIKIKLVFHSFLYRSKFYRQTLIFSSLASPEINAVFNKNSHSILERKDKRRAEIYSKPYIGKLNNVPTDYRIDHRKSIIRSLKYRPNVLVVSIFS